MSETRNFIDPEVLAGDLRINPALLDDCFREHAGLFAHYAAQHAQAVRQAESMKLIMDVVESKIDKRLRDEAASIGSKITAAEIEKAIARDPEYITARRRSIEAQAALQLAKDACEAFRHRRDMLVQMGANAREEMKGDLSMRVKQELRERMAPA